MAKKVKGGGPSAKKDKKKSAKGKLNTRKPLKPYKVKGKKKKKGSSSTAKTYSGTLTGSGKNADKTSMKNAKR